MTRTAVEDELLTVGDAARLAGVTTNTVRYWHRMGQLTGRRTAGGVRLFERRDVLQLIKDRRPAELGLLEAKVAGLSL